jgi:O-succinylbenzoic acid--CoA ligase
VLSGSFDAGKLAEGIARARSQDPSSRVHVSLVPTQLVDALASPGCREALAGCASVLLGGAAADSALLARATAAGVPVRVTYGMSETCGGCVYDGVPLAGMQIGLDDRTGAIRLGGPMVMSGYLDGDLGVQTQDGVRWLTTSDLGHLDAGRLVIDGRADDVIISGGLKINASEVTEAIRATGMATRAAVLGLDDERWGQLVAAVVVPSPAWTSAPDLRDAVAARLPRTHAPRLVITVERLPMLASGKIDRVGLRELADRARSEGRAWCRD